MGSWHLNRTEEKLSFEIINVCMAAMAKTQGRAHILRIVMVIPARATEVGKHYIMAMSFMMHRWIISARHKSQCQYIGC